MRNTANEVIFTPLNLHIVACVNVRMTLGKIGLIKRNFMTVSVRVSFGYTREVWRTRAREVRVTVALVHGRKLLYAFHCWEKHSFPS